MAGFAPCIVSYHTGILRRRIVSSCGMICRADPKAPIFRGGSDARWWWWGVGTLSLSAPDGCGIYGTVHDGWGDGRRMDGQVLDICG